jgi:RNA polymerase sigma factor (sigma-70 family)
MCHECPLRRTCSNICSYVEFQLPSIESGRVDHEDLDRLYRGKLMTQAILDNAHMLTRRQQEVVQLYYRENRQQREIAELLSITQQAVGDALARAKSTLGKRLKAYYSFF